LSAGAAPRLPIDLGAPVSLARVVRFDGAGPRHFGAPAARAWPDSVPGFKGEVRRGASCNCTTLELTPHCHGTHTESVAHLVEEALDVCDLVPLGLMPALVVSVAPVDAATTGEDSDPAPQPGDRLLTRAALLQGWPASLPFAPRALVLRMRDAAGATAPDDAGSPPDGPEGADVATPYLSRQLVGELVARGIEHLVVELPSIDRGHDGGRLCGHRLFFGLPPGSTRLAEATRRDCTVTEYARVPASLADGPCALQLTLPRLAGDAVPSRPLAFRLAAP
jgi:kynurenine formamidase